MKNKSKPKKIKQQTEVIAAYCEKCDIWIYSCARHHFNSCPKGCISIDGGRFYTKLSSKDKPPETKKFIINATEAELYNDWNKGEDKFGIIHNLNS